MDRVSVWRFPMKEIKETMREKGRSTVWRKKTWPAWESNFWRMEIDSRFSRFTVWVRHAEFSPGNGPWTRIPTLHCWIFPWKYMIGQWPVYGHRDEMPSKRSSRRNAVKRTSRFVVEKRMADAFESNRSSYIRRIFPMRVANRIQCQIPPRQHDETTQRLMPSSTIIILGERCQLEAKTGHFPKKFSQGTASTIISIDLPLLQKWFYEARRLTFDQLPVTHEIGHRKDVASSNKMRESLRDSCGGSSGFPRVFLLHFSPTPWKKSLFLSVFSILKSKFEILKNDVIFLNPGLPQKIQ